MPPPPRSPGATHFLDMVTKLWWWTVALRVRPSLMAMALKWFCTA